jgi:predicted RNA-binding protein associated with RNAse of E/G family
MTPEQLNALIIEYNKALEQGQITKEEYMELLKGINIMEGIADDAEGLALKEQLNLIINAAISAASLMA